MIVSGLKILKIIGFSVTDTMIDPSTIPALSIPVSNHQVQKDYLLSQDSLKFWPMRWRQRPTVIIREWLCFPNKKSKGRRCPCALIPALEVDVMPGIMATTL